MKAATLLLEALTPTGRRAAFGLAARGKDLVLCGEMPSMLEELAAELRVVHGVDVRTCVADLGDEEAIGEITAWVDSHAIAVDGLIFPRWGDTDPVRATQLERHAAELEKALHRAFRRAGVESRLRFVSATSRPPAPGGPRQRKRASILPSRLPPLADEGEKRPRRSTRPGHSDPSGGHSAS